MSKEDILNDLMTLFEQSVGMNVRVKGTPLVDEITGVNWDLMTVKVKTYGEFGVHLCELTNEKNTTIGNQKPHAATDTALGDEQARF